MYILENVPLSTHSTMRLGGNAAYLTDISTRQEIAEAITWAEERQLPVMMIGDGSNIVWEDIGYPGLVLVNKIEGYELTGDYDDSQYITAGAGMNWDNFVAKTVEAGLSGVEFMSLIPGTVGATPVQNVGAYGGEVSNVITTIEAYDKEQKQFVTLRGSDCGFDYRTSIFKTTERGRYFIINVTFCLQKTAPQPPFYASLQSYFDEHKVTDITPAAIREAVIAIRSAKLPDPAVVANNGSFFANPIISNADALQLTADFPDAPHWQTAAGVKVSAAWLIEKAGFKDRHDAETGMATWATQPLVLVNEHAESTAQLKAFKAKLVNTVQQKFGITLEQEPELI